MSIAERKVLSQSIGIYGNPKIKKIIEDGKKLTAVLNKSISKVTWYHFGSCSSVFWLFAVKFTVLNLCWAALIQSTL